VCGARVLWFSVLLLVALKPASAESPVIVHPELMAGPWEVRARNEDGSRYITMVTRIETVPSEGSERLEAIYVEISVVPAPDTTSVSPETGSAHMAWRHACWSKAGDCGFDGTRLVVKTSRGPDVPHDLELDVRFDASRAAWLGEFIQDGSGAEVRFERPRRGPGIPADALEGNWRDTTSQSLRCVHARQRADGELLMWLDRVGDGDLRNPYGRNSYGADIFRWEKATQRGSVRLQTGENSGNGPDTFEGVLARDGSRFEGYWRHPHLPAFRSVFVRTEGESCSPR